jgi:hypothetical protein
VPALLLVPAVVLLKRRVPLPLSWLRPQWQPLPQSDLRPALLLRQQVTHHYPGYRQRHGGN